MKIVPATGPEQLRQVRLFEEYAASLSFDLRLQNFRQELDGLPGAKLSIERLNYQGFGLQEQLALFAALRRHAARILKLQSPEAWSRTAVHSLSGLLTLRQLVLQAVRHLRHHLPFIAEKRAALGASRP